MGVCSRAIAYLPTFKWLFTIYRHNYNPPTSKHFSMMMIRKLYFLVLYQMSSPSGFGELG
ncbi:MAG: hypothetical protein V7K97_02240 [Nostoc sp.]|uniref:hypothetical protein n=1 Tax=Nostoc sp. TaxID=1180 RepID=UPI002FF63D25